MIISNQQIQEVLRLYGANRIQGKGTKEQHPAKAAEPESEQGVDRAELSAKALDHQKLREAVLKTPETRDDRIQQIREALDKGSYNVSAEDVAEKMLGRLLVDYLV